MNSIEYRLGDTKVTVHSGYKTIGGNIIEVRSGDSSIILDIGLNLNLKNKFYTLTTHRLGGIEEYIRLGIAPYVEGLYTRWLDDGNTPDKDYGVDTHIRGIFISHMHSDHYGLIPQVNRNIPIYMGETSSYILDIKIDLYSHYKYEKMDLIRENIETYRTGEKKPIDDFIITPIHVDHSVPGAYGFKVETPDGVIAYTGDYRLHGQDESLTMDFINELAEDDVALYITEATRVHDIEYNTENEVREKLRWIMNNAPKATVLIECSPLDIDRFYSILSVANEFGKRIYLNKNFYYYLTKYFMEDKKLRDKLDKKYFRDICKGVFTGNISKNEKEYLAVASKYLDYETNIDQLDIRRGDLIIGMNLGINLCRRDVLEGEKLAIFSNSEPFDEEGEIDFQRDLNWLTAFNIPSYRVHASGHISILELKDIVENVKPRDVLVIHSQYPDLVKKILGYK